MKSGSYDATLSNWNVCELEDGRRFLSGKVSGDRKGRFREGGYITTSLALSPIEAIAEGEIIETLNSRYLLTQRNKADDANFAKLDAWLAQQPSPPTLFGVLAARDGRPLGLFRAPWLPGSRRRGRVAQQEGRLGDRRGR